MKQDNLTKILVQITEICIDFSKVFLAINFELSQASLLMDHQMSNTQLKKTTYSFINEGKKNLQKKKNNVIALFSTIKKVHGHERTESLGFHKRVSSSTIASCLPYASAAEIRLPFDASMRWVQFFFFPICTIQYSSIPMCLN